MGESLSNASLGQVVIAHLDAVAILPGNIPGDDLCNLLLRLWGSSTAAAESGAGSVVEYVDDV
jgi:hypothetical protein